MKFQKGDEVIIKGRNSDAVFVLGYSDYFKDANGMPLVNISTTSNGRVTESISSKLLSFSNKNP